MVNDKGKCNLASVRLHFIRGSLLKRGPGVDGSGEGVQKYMK